MRRRGGRRVDFFRGVNKWFDATFDASLRSHDRRAAPRAMATTAAACAGFVHRARRARSTRISTPRAAAKDGGGNATVPHSGYHRIVGFPRPFFEGWYFRVTLPETRDNLSLIYHVYDPDLTSSTRRGAGAQACTPGGGYIYRESSDVDAFSGDPHALALRMTLGGGGDGDGGGGGGGLFTQDDQLLYDHLFDQPKSDVVLSDDDESSSFKTNKTLLGTFSGSDTSDVCKMGCVVFSKTSALYAPTST